MDAIPYPFLTRWFVAPLQCAPKGTEVQRVKEIISTNGIMVTNPILPSLMWPYRVCQICAILVEHNPPSFSSKFLQLLLSFHHILFLVASIIGIPGGTSFD